MSVKCFVAIMFLSFIKFGDYINVCQKGTKGSSIRCYECNSINNSMCLDPSTYDPANVQKYLTTKTCEKSLIAPPQGSQMFCRKIIQTILHKGHDSEVRVTRGCGWVKHHKECYKADNEDHLETVCQCFTDHCNAAATLQATVAVITTTVALWLQ